MGLWITSQLALVSRRDNHRIFRPKSQKIGPIIDPTLNATKMAYFITKLDPTKSSLNQRVETPTTLPCLLKDTACHHRQQLSLNCFFTTTLYFSRKIFYAERFACLQKI